MNTWKPIETAPRDGEFILIYIPQKFNHGFYIVHWCHDHFQTCETTWIGKDLPTHWTELPETPEDK